MLTKTMPQNADTNLKDQILKSNSFLSKLLQEDPNDRPDAKEAKKLWDTLQNNGEWKKMVKDAKDLISKNNLHRNSSSSSLDSEKIAMPSTEVGNKIKSVSEVEIQKLNSKLDTLFSHLYNADAELKKILTDAKNFDIESAWVTSIEVVNKFYSICNFVATKLNIKDFPDKKDINRELEEREITLNEQLTTLCTKTLACNVKSIGRDREIVFNNIDNYTEKAIKILADNFKLKYDSKDKEIILKQSPGLDKLVAMSICSDDFKALVSQGNISKIKHR